MKSKTPLPVSVFGVLLSFSGIVGYVGVGMWLIVPTNDHVCMARVWLGCIAISLMLSCSISRTSNIRSFAKADKKRDSIVKFKKLQSQPLWRTYLDAIVILTAQLVILIIWQSVDPYRSTIEVLDSFNLVGEYHCIMNTLGFWGVEGVFIAIIVTYGVLQLYLSWEMVGNIGLSKWILFSLYNVILTGAACLPIIALISGEQNLCSVVVSGGLFIYAQLQFSFYLPALSNPNSDSTSTSSRVSKTSVSQKRSDK